MHHASIIMHCRYEAEIWYVDCSHKYKMNQGVMVGGRRPSVEDNLRWKTTFGGRQPSVEDDLGSKTTFCGTLCATSKQGRKLRFCMLTVITNISVMVGGRRPSVEDELR